MRVVAPFFTAILVLGVAASAAEAQAPQDLAGAWIVTSWTSPDGDVDSEPQRGLFTFTASGAYSMMYVLGTEPRAQYSGEGQTDEETLAAYASFVANSGRYAVEGNRITFEAYMAKDPNYMAGFGTEEGNGVTVEFGIEDEILTLSWVDGFSQGASATFRRPRAN
jgi:hypothetical protein